VFNEPISSIGTGTGLPGAITDSWDINKLKLTYQTSDLNFLQYNPKYFLFVYRANKKFGRPSQVYPNTRTNNEKYGKYFSHPANATGSAGTTITSIPTYNNFSAIGQEEIAILEPTFTSLTTEWNVNTDSGQPVALNGFNPLRFYKSQLAVNNYGGTTHTGQEFFPFPYSDTEHVRTTSYPNKKSIDSKTSDGFTTTINPRTNLYIKFAIVVQDPTNSARYIIGPMSDTVKIIPKAGYFNDDVDTGVTIKYYYDWATNIV
jgi:hypothetical protein